MVGKAIKKDAIQTRLKNGQPPDMPFILREKGTANHEVAITWLKKQPWWNDLSAPVLLSDMESIKQMIMLEAGVTIIPQTCIAKEIDNGEITRFAVTPPLGKIKYYLIERMGEAGEYNPIIQRFLEIFYMNRTRCCKV